MHFKIHQAACYAKHANYILNTLQTKCDLTASAAQISQWPVHMFMSGMGIRELSMCRGAPAMEEACPLLRFICALHFAQLLQSTGLDDITSLS